jgi:hypothetical protein
MNCIWPSRTAQGFALWVAFATALLIAKLSPAPLFATDVIVNGDDGAHGTSGASGPSGESGGHGQPGEDATAVSNAAGQSSNYAEANGGNGGSGGSGGNATQIGGTGGNGGNGGAGGDANASATATASAVIVSATALAFGGTGGSGGLAGGNIFIPGDYAASGAPGSAGDAHAAASATNNLPGGNAYAQATSTGGSGVQATRAPHPSGSHGGTASVDNVFAMANNGLASAQVFVTGGAGGAANANSPGGSGGNGATVILTNKVNGSTTGALSLHQQANGGSAGAGNFNGGVPGTAGAASSSLTLTNTVASSIAATVQATGGNGGELLSPTSGGDGAAGTTNIDITGKGPVTVNATSYGGTGGFANGVPQAGDGGDATATARGASTTAGDVFARADGFAGTGGIGPMATPGANGLGSATADAISVQGYRAAAQARAIGRMATATARSRTAGGSISSQLLTADGTNHVDLEARTLAAVGGPEGFSAGSFPGYHAFGNTVGLPSEGDVADELVGDSDVSLVYGTSGNNRTPLALLELQLTRPNSDPGLATTLSVTADYSFNLGQLQSGNLFVGLLDPTSSGPTFTSLHFTITREGATVEDQTFLTAAAATAYFDDHILNLGDIDTGVTGTLDLSFSLEMSSPNNGTSFNTTLLVADVGPDILPGDYNDDGKTDAADYVVWRKHEGTMIILPNDPHGGTIGANQFNTWRANFGKIFIPVPPGGGAGIGPSAVPEPDALVLLLLTAAGISLGQRRNARTVSKLARD